MLDEFGDCAALASTPAKRRCFLNLTFNDEAKDRWSLWATLDLVSQSPERHYFVGWDGSVTTTVEEADDSDQNDLHLPITETEAAQLQMLAVHSPDPDAWGTAARRWMLARWDTRTLPRNESMAR